MLFIIVYSSYCQDYYYGSNNQKIYLQKSEQWIIAQIERNDVQQFEHSVSSIAGLIIKKKIKEEKGIYWLESTEGSTLKNKLT